MFAKIKRFYRWFMCDHKNMMMQWLDHSGWNIMVCRKCGRAWVFTDGADPEKNRRKAVDAVDCIT